jgi:hypothetical protein
MKISFGSKIKKTAWGGGNQFLINISNYLKLKNIEVVYDLNDHDIDIIVLMDPRIDSSSSTFNHIDIDQYLKFKNKNAIIIHRINECDERKGTNYVNKNLIDANKFADYTIFISSWLRELLNKNKEFKDSSVILNGANKKIFSFSNFNKNPERKIKIVTHHWSAHRNKGFEIYEYLDQLLDEKNFSKLVEFTFIGNLPKNFKFKNANFFPPKNGKELADKIKENDVYLTASLNEPGGNHQNEGLNCGLPVLYLNSGCMEEYCKGYGLNYEKHLLKKKIFEIQTNYNYYKEKLKTYPYNSDFMCKNYLDIFDKLMKNRKEILKNRRFPKINFFTKLKYKLNLKFF